MSGNDTISVVVCDDLRGNELRNAARRDRSSPKIDVYPVKTGAELLAMLDHDFDVALIDNWVPFTSLETNAPRAVHLVAEITRARGRNTPLRILWCNDANELDLYSFIAFGGHNYANKNQPAMCRVALETIRATVAGDRWQPPLLPLGDEEGERRLRRELRLIALLANGDRTDSIAAQLGTTAATVSTTIGKLAETLGLTTENGRYDIHIPQSAIRAGYYYVPKVYWRDAPDDALWPGEIERRAH